MKHWYILLVVTLASAALTALLRVYALRRSIIDIPNARSSHTVPTPRGGGVAVVVVFALALVSMAWLQLASPREVVALLGAGLLVAVIGFMDDHGHIAARWRLLGHFLAAAWALFWMQGLPALKVFGVTFELGWVGHGLALLYLVWMLNLYNFMDGIDGIASIEAICACLGLTLIYFLHGQEPLAWAPLVLAAAVAGFLYWNFPPARIFMGDAGSGFLGIVLGCLSLQAAWAGGEFFFAWLIMLGIFIVDATFTLIRRLIRGDRVYEAHRSHAYQYASRQYGAHFPVTLGVGMINLCWLLPLSVAVSFQWLDPALGMIIAYLPLVYLAVKYKAGAREEGA